MDARLSDLSIVSESVHSADSSRVAHRTVRQARTNFHRSMGKYDIFDFKPRKRVK